MKIGIDLDAVLFDISVIFKEANESLGIEYIPPDVWSMDCYTADVKMEIFRRLKDPEHVGNMPLTEPLIDLVEHFYNWKKEGHDLYIVSSRYRECHHITRTLCEYMFPMMDDIHLVTESKKDKLIELDIDVHIDDGPHVVEECIQNEIPIIMISNEKTPYNYYLRDKVSHTYSILNITAESLEHVLYAAYCI